jgi:hypothetical protein
VEAAQVPVVSPSWSGVEPNRTIAVHDALAHPAEQLLGWSVIGRAEGDPADVRIFRLQRQAAGSVLIEVDPA